MRPDQFRKIASHPLREVLNAMIVKDARRLPGKRALEAMIVKALPNESETMHAEVYDTALALAKKALGGSWGTIEARQHADNATLKVVETLATDDQIIPWRDEPEVDPAAIAEDQLDQLAHPGETESMRAQRHKDEAERARLVKLGFSPSQ